MPIGFGYDIHRLVVDRPCIIGGVSIPFAKGLSGHSDADVLYHAITDALLGAVSAGDIGQHFPDTDEKNRDLKSEIFLKKAGDIVRQKGFQIENVDSTVVAEAPKMMPYIAEMVANVARCLELEPNSVSVKATTNEGIGTIGRGEGIAAFAVVSLTQTRSS